MSFLKKVGAWLKKYWYLALTFVAVGVSLLLFGDKSKSLAKLLDEQRKDNDTHRKEVEEITENQIEERDSHVSDFLDKKDELDARREEKLEQIEKEKKERVEELKKEDDLASKIEKEFDL